VLPVELNVYQALVVNKESDIAIQGVPLKEVFNSMLQLSTMLSHTE
jgi:hypothetical protein